ncbi:hypothetical protein [cf. Phormidesmis sp. LEGE 11477]|uniref:hypothetical protein n=1 Tax=cf. Phormidesmis sp. LEGE 11477 TaxID=1828680 RepID=UPI0018803D97|nr:hypothetical protein [cf. Phormidesmis sp. LEGE 11477]MBE9061085.1 hypothetical protein [cf. Phormidesmis sp. LEGE 11477]
MKVSTIGYQLTKILRLASRSKSALVLLVLLAGCTVAETGPGVPSGSEVPLPPVSLPGGLRMPGSPMAINALSAERAEDKVAISGRVMQRVAILDGWLYQIQDDTGSLWVLTRQSEPSVGDAATVSGIVKYEAIVIDAIDASEIYLEEQSYRLAERPSSSEESQSEDN